MQRISVFIFLAFAQPTFAACNKPITGQPTEVATPAAAVAAAKAAWKSIYAKASWQTEFSPENIALDEPYVATLKDGVWRVIGTLPPGVVGGTPEAEVCQLDGSVSASHSK